VDVYWFEQSENDVPADDEWLSTAEQARLQALRFVKRRNDWRLGRWTAKNAAASCLEHSSAKHVLSTIEIRAAKSGAPEVFVSNQPAAATISITHRNGVAACAVSLCAKVALGCDLELVEPHTEAFIADYFTDEEQEVLAQTAKAERFALVSLLWSAKESALKAISEGLRLDTREMNIQLERGDFERSLKIRVEWHPVVVESKHHGTFAGWWQIEGNVVRTLVASPTPYVPKMLATCYA
jgi:4'-phosphopantetheinyl transferase